jgi:hypothetical protein
VYTAAAAAKHGQAGRQLGFSQCTLSFFVDRETGRQASGARTFAGAFADAIARPQYIAVLHPAFDGGGPSGLGGEEVEAGPIVAEQPCGAGAIDGPCGVIAAGEARRGEGPVLTQARRRVQLICAIPCPCPCLGVALCWPTSSDDEGLVVDLAVAVRPPAVVLFARGPSGLEHEHSPHLRPGVPVHRGVRGEGHSHAHMPERPCARCRRDGVDDSVRAWVRPCC